MERQPWSRSSGTRLSRASGQCPWWARLWQPQWHHVDEVLIPSASPCFLAAVEGKAPGTVLALVCSEAACITAAEVMASRTMHCLTLLEYGSTLLTVGMLSVWNTILTTQVRSSSCHK
jgi:hypothetical protein